MSASDTVAWVVGILVLAVVFHFGWFRHQLNRWRAERSFPGLDGELGLTHVARGSDALGRLVGLHQGYAVLIDPTSGIELELQSRPAAWLDLVDHRVRADGKLREMTLTDPLLSRVFRTRLGSDATAAWMNRGGRELAAIVDFARRWRRRLETLSLRDGKLRCRPKLGAWTESPSITASQIRELLPAMVAVARAFEAMPQLEAEPRVQVTLPRPPE